MDSWIKLLDVEANGERTRTLYMIKSRGMSHSNQMREFRITAEGIEVVEAYVGPGGVLTGTARVIQEANERAAALRRRQDSERRRRDLFRRRGAIERQIAELRASLDAAEEEESLLYAEDDTREAELERERLVVSARRDAAE